uniref:Ribosomal protein L9 domain-containing protein n=1 Tax=Chromera velia CCMP2878 TaxID=1169474 RepID=A0A0G4HZR5_9ALVE|mmetsp:Transcript_51508/g.101097  ORF Transcript_51508/g.101097 Transcript_51508/m.101097 type:complete len:351 (+) Transcript_51508:141-1193(+)|eukprot:Cvel_9783.t1-p1 / transcript=Cvel_9783.t1 / gene=Cvel_9783 / organism=Chromera_velia_CCMP2878 / gene_product=50S ribosomal protein L9, putative / transcript_product=50S ribosomal protein L9, putative / location=Cvel_scaffold574:1979-3028(-) / protein_length=350 / sequence_SO=supercontig / SO=protein_coding / is_pseudo=false
MGGCVALGVACCLFALLLETPRGFSVGFADVPWPSPSLSRRPGRSAADFLTRLEATKNKGFLRVKRDLRYNITLLVDHKQLGVSGDIISVKPSTAHNWLIPFNIGRYSLPEDFQVVAERQKEDREARTVRKAEFEATRDVLEAEPLFFIRSPNPDKPSELEAVISQEDVLDALKEQVGFEGKRMNILCSVGLKSMDVFGVYNIGVRIAGPVVAKVRAVVAPTREVADTLALERDAYMDFIELLSLSDVDDDRKAAQEERIRRKKALLAKAEARKQMRKGSSVSKKQAKEDVEKELLQDQSDREAALNKETLSSLFVGDGLAAALAKESDDPKEVPAYMEGLDDDESDEDE